MIDRVSRYSSPFPKVIADSRSKIVDQTTDLIMDPAKTIREQCAAWIIEHLLDAEPDTEYFYKEIGDLIDKAIDRKNSGQASDG